MKTLKYPKILIAALIAYSLGAFLLAFSPFGNVIYFSPSETTPTQNFLQPFYSTISISLLALTSILFIFLIFKTIKNRKIENA